ncbi:unnamed protein product [Paramecium primaurelia]|uniref:Uncharacterized protein n=1 Tax=Paramecium primaurelia TaxID=5886 RepID=A0A8S1KG18_PARPR|nr:unnamed protein product [Paramecium primaurelia]
MIKQMYDISDEYIQDYQRNYIKNNELLTKNFFLKGIQQIKKNFKVVNNIKQIFKIFISFIQKGIKGNQVVENQLINDDLEQIKYIINYPVYNPYQDQNCQEQIQQDILDAAELSSDKHNKIPQRKPTQSIKYSKLQKQDYMYPQIFRLIMNHQNLLKYEIVRKVN